MSIVKHKITVLLYSFFFSTKMSATKNTKCIIVFIFKTVEVNVTLKSSMMFPE